MFAETQPWIDLVAQTAERLSGRAAALFDMVKRIFEVVRDSGKASLPSGPTLPAYAGGARETWVLHCRDDTNLVVFAQRQAILPRLGSLRQDDEAVSSGRALERRAASHAARGRFNSDTVHQLRR